VFAKSEAPFRQWGKEAGFREATSPAVNGFVQRLKSAVPYLRIRHTRVGNRLVGVQIADPPDGDQDDEELAMCHNYGNSTVV
jgi:hypothetical protein